VPAQKLFKERPNRREVLLHSRRGSGVLPDVSRHQHGLDLVEVADVERPALVQELRDGLCVRGARVRVPDVCGEKLDEAPGGVLAGARHDRGKSLESGATEVLRRNCEDFLGHPTL